jgi:sugar lactone lactonase YvrE
MKHVLIAASVVCVLLVGCATSKSTAKKPPEKKSPELLVDATTKPAAAAAAVATPIVQPPEAEPARPYYPRADLAAGYVVDPQWPLAKPLIPWGSMAGATVDAHGNIWTLNRGTQPVQVFSPEGKLLQMWPNTYVKAGHQIRIDRDGNIWIPDYRLHVVRKLDRSGQLLLTIGIPDWPGTDDRRLNMPTDVAFAPNGDVFISDGYRNNRIVHCDANGKFIKAWGRMGVAEGEFSLPHSIVMDSKGLLYVADRNNNRIQVFDQSGKFVRAWTGMMVPWTIWITNSDELYVIGSSPSRWNAGEIMVGIPPKDQLIMRLSTDFEIRGWWTFPFQPDATKLKPGDLNWVHAVAVDNDGNLYLGDIQGARIQKFWAALPTTTTMTTTTTSGGRTAPATRPVERPSQITRP